MSRVNFQIFTVLLEGYLNRRHHPLLGEVKHGKVRAWSRSHRILESYSSHQNSGSPILALFSHSALRATPKAWAFRQVSHILCIVPILENVSTQQHTEWKCKCNRLLSPGPRTSWNSQLKPSNAMSSASSKSSSDFTTEVSSSFIHTRIHTWIKQYKPKPKNIYPKYLDAWCSFSWCELGGKMRNERRNFTVSTRQCLGELITLLFYNVTQSPQTGPRSTFPAGWSFPTSSYWSLLLFRPHRAVPLLTRLSTLHLPPQDFSKEQPTLSINWPNQPSS